MLRYVFIPPAAQIKRRILPLVVGLTLCGIAFASIVHASLGLDPWNVLHEGLSDITGISIGMVSIGVGVVVLLGWIPLKERMGIGTILNVLIIGIVMDIWLAIVPEAETLPARWGWLLLGLFLAGPGIGMYIGARLGPGPRDGIMTGVAQRGPSIRLVRTLIELTALAIGFLLGGTVGIGTVLFAVTVGPNAQFWLERLDMGHPLGFKPDIDPEIDIDATTAGS